MEYVIITFSFQSYEGSYNTPTRMHAHLRFDFFVRKPAVDFASCGVSDVVMRHSFVCYWIGLCVFIHFVRDQVKLRPRATFSLTSS